MKRPKPDTIWRLWKLLTEEEAQWMLAAPERCSYCGHLLAFVFPGEEGGCALCARQEPKGPCA